MLQQKTLWNRTWTTKKVSENIIYVRWWKQMSVCCSLSTKATCNNVLSKKIIISDKNHQNICWEYLYIWDARRQTSGSQMKLILICIWYINDTVHTNFSSFGNQNDYYINFELSQKFLTWIFRERNWGFMISFFTMNTVFHF